MPMRITQRYLIAEFLQWFALCFLGFSVLSIGYFLFSMNDFFVGLRMPLSMVLSLVAQRFPMLVLDVVPSAVLFGVFLGMGRLAWDRELDVLRTSGWSFVGLVTPILAAAFIIATGVFVWYDTVVPACNRTFQDQMSHLRYQDILPMITENTFIKGPKNQYFYIRRVNNNTHRLEGVMIFETQNNGYPRIITAETGRLSGNNWELFNGFIHDLDQKGWVRYEVKFDKMMVNAGNDLTGFFGKQDSIEEMTRKELRDKMILYAKSGFPVATYAVEYYNKTAIPYASLILAFIAIPFTRLFSRKSWAMGLICSFLVIITYFFSQVMFRNMGQNTIISPMFAAWGPNIIFLSLALILLNRVKR